jgi:hypothetical protein
MADDEGDRGDGPGRGNGPGLVTWPIEVSFGARIVDRGDLEVNHSTRDAEDVPLVSKYQGKWTVAYNPHRYGTYIRNSASENLSAHREN